MKPLFEKAEAKNKLLRSVAGGGVDSLSQLQGRWDKFELMMESHQLMVKEQVSLSWEFKDEDGLLVFSLEAVCINRSQSIFSQDGMYMNRVHYFFS